MPSYTPRKVVLTLWKLVGSVYVVASNDDDWQLKALGVSVDVHLRGSFTGRVRVRWSEYTIFEEVFVVKADLAHDFVCRDVNEPFDTGLNGTLQHCMRSFHVCFGELERVSKTQVHMRLSSEVENRVNLVLLEYSENI
jgi:hypothetical protein